MSIQKFNTTELDLRPRIAVIGVGGAGGNAVNNMVRAKLEGVEFVIANTDAQSIDQSLVLAERRIQLGLHITQGLGAGSKPDVGRASAEESLEEVLHHLKGNNMVFITAGMGGGTGTGAAPVIARAVRESGILTVGVVTKPFHFEGAHRMRIAEKGIEELQQYVDTLIIIPNQNLFRVANERTTFAQAFELADNVLSSGVRNVTDLMMRPGLINLDFADIRSVMAEMGKAMMGTGEAEGDNRALEAAAKATDNPLLDDVSMKGAKGVLINITGGPDMTLFEVDEAANQVRENADPDANIIFGSTFDEKLTGKIRVSVVATGIGAAKNSWRQGGLEVEPAASLNLGARSPSFQEAPFKEPQGSFTTPFATRNSGYGVDSNPVYEFSPDSSPNSSFGSTKGGVNNVVRSPKDGDASQQYAGTYQTTPAAISSSLSPSLSAAEFDDAQLSKSPLSKSSGESPDDQLVYGQGQHNPNSDQEKIGQERVSQERKRPPTLFERITGTGRNRSQVAPEKSPRTSPVEEEKNQDFNEIPAFLRRGN